MLKSFILAIALMVGTNANADFFQTEVQSAITAAIQTASGPNFKVGETADYKLSGGIINGTMHVQVREEVAEGFWIQQDMNLGFLGKQKVEILQDKSTGQIITLLVNGEKQTPPDPKDLTVIEMKEDHITVPKGSFDCVYVKVRDNKNNQESEAWLNPSIVPISGMIKTLSPSQMGTITIVLTDFHKLP